MFSPCYSPHADHLNARVTVTYQRRHTKLGNRLTTHVYRYVIHASPGHLQDPDILSLRDPERNLLFEEPWEAELVTLETTMSLPESAVVPGLEPGWKVHVSGGGENTEWLNFEAKKNYTNAFIICGAKVFFNLSGTIFSFPPCIDTAWVQEARVRERIVSFFHRFRDC